MRVIPLLLLLQFFTPAPPEVRTERTLLQGTWISCPQDEGDYGERARDFTVHGHPWFELHMGPRDEFALFAGNTPEHLAHDSPANKLGPGFHFNDLVTVAGGRTWSSAQLGVRLNVVAIPPTREECYAFILLLERDKSPTWANR